VSARALCIAMGNVLRRDDGAGRRVLELIGCVPGVVKRDVFQLTPEISAEIATMDVVVFVDADVNPGKPGIEPLAGDAGRTPLTHFLGPAEVVRMAETLYGFHGAAFVCRVSGVDFGAGAGLSADAEASARKAADDLKAMFAASLPVRLSITGPI
jgi:hydrogenase maturation protease